MNKEVFMNADMRDYYDYTVAPIGKLFYATVHSQLGALAGLKILDFGSGFAFTTDYLAKDNDVTAIEPDESMIEAARKTNKYNLVNGSIDELKKLPERSFDVIICHLVLEYMQQREELMSEFCRVLKPEGFVSVVRHNKPGRIIQAVVQDYDLADAKRLLNGENSASPAFGEIADYENEDLETWSQNGLKIKKVHGVRSLASLHDSELQNSEGWLENMMRMEQELLQHKVYIDIAYFNHVILVKN